MPNIILPDGKKLSFKDKVTGLEIASKISKSLSKQALIMSVNGDLKDLSHEITKDSKVRIITPKDKEGLDVIRHDAAHMPMPSEAQLTSSPPMQTQPPQQQQPQQQAPQLNAEELKQSLQQVEQQPQPQQFQQQRPEHQPDLQATARPATAPTASVAGSKFRRMAAACARTYTVSGSCKYGCAFEE